MQNWLNGLMSRLRDQKGMATWIWIVILFVILGIGTIMGLPYENIDRSGAATPSVLGSTGQLVSVFLKWMAVIGLVYVAFIFVRRWQLGSSAEQVKQLRVVERLALSQKQSLLLVRAGERSLLLGATDQNITLLTELEEPAAFQAAAKMDGANTLDGGNGFDSLLKKNMTGNVSDSFDPLRKK